MAVCEVCQKSGKTRIIAGITFCDECFEMLQSLRAGDPEGIAYYTNPDILAPASKTARSYFASILANQTSSTEALLERARQQEEQRKAFLESMILTTCPSIEGMRVTKQLGLVSGEVVFKIGFFKSLSASFDNFGSMLAFGDQELSGTSRLLADARHYSIEKLKQNAVELGANAVIGIDSESSMGGDFMHITINGTAVFVEEIQ